jgi:hypothetical protein
MISIPSKEPSEYDKSHIVMSPRAGVLPQLGDDQPSR